MANFAKIGINNTVTQVVHIDNACTQDSNGQEHEFIGQEYLKRLTGSDAWIQCSFRTRGGVHYDDNNQPDGLPGLRKNYPSIGDRYDFDRQAFIAPKPQRFPSWILNEQTCCWEPPVPPPTVEDHNMLAWDEHTVSWIVKIQDGLHDTGYPRYVFPK